MKIKRGSTSVRRLIFIADSSSTTGAGLASLAYNTAGLVAYYFAGDLADEVEIPLATATLGTWASGGFVAVDNTNMPGWYEIGIPDSALDGGNEVAMQLSGATNMVPVNIYVELDAIDYQTALATVITTGLTTALTEGYRSTNATGSVRDLLYEILQNITEFAISGTTKTVKQIDGSTTAKTYTYNSSTAPTSITEAT